MLKIMGIIITFLFCNCNCKYQHINDYKALHMSRPTLMQVETFCKNLNPYRRLTEPLLFIKLVFTYELLYTTLVHTGGLIGY